MKKYLFAIIVSVFSMMVISCEKEDFNSSDSGGDSDCCGGEVELPIEPGDTTGEG